MDPVSSDSLLGGPASPPGPGAIFDRPEGKIDLKETALPFNRMSMALRSHSRAGRSESTQSVENLPERCGGAHRPETEIAQPEVVDALYPGRDLSDVSDSHR